MRNVGASLVVLALLSFCALAECAWPRTSRYVYFNGTNVALDFDANGVVGSVYMTHIDFWSDFTAKMTLSTGYEPLRNTRKYNYHLSRGDLGLDYWWHIVDGVNTGCTAVTGLPFFNPFEAQNVTLVYRGFTSGWQTGDLYRGFLGPFSVDLAFTVPAYDKVVYVGVYPTRPMPSSTAAYTEQDRFSMAPIPQHLFDVPPFCTQAPVTRVAAGTPLRMH